MGLDWVLMDREHNGRVITPEETLGAIRLDPDNPESVKQFTNLVERHREQINDPDLSCTPQYVEKWSTDLDTLIALHTGELLPAPDANLPNFSGGGMIAPRTAWRGKRLGYIEGLDDDLANQAWSDMDPQEAAAYADDLASVLPSIPTAAELGPDSDMEGREAVQEAIDYLRFWSERGHGIHAWY
jgi:hypothetical protein